MSKLPPPNHDQAYLWNRSEPADSQVEHLERILAPYAWRSDRKLSFKVTPALPSRRGHWRIGLASAAMLATIMLVVAGWFWHRLQWPAAQPWVVAATSGQVRIDGRAIDQSAMFAPGSEIRTGEHASAQLEVARIGQLVLGADSRLSLVTTRSGHHRVRLQRGSLWARIWAPPRSFGVSMAGADLVDLGCEFVLRVDSDGNGELAVQSGWIAIDGARHEVLVPQGARLTLSASGVVGLPKDLGASASFVTALDRIDALDGAVAPDGVVMQDLLAAARPRDAISLLSLLDRYPHLAQGPLFDHLAAMLQADAVVTRAALRNKGPVALDPWWRALPYPQVKRWWLHWPDAFAGTPPQLRLK